MPLRTNRGNEYERCFAEARGIGELRRQRHIGKNPTPRNQQFEQDTVGVIGECGFAQHANLSTEPIYAAVAGLADFEWLGHRIEVKTFGIEPARPNKMCHLLVRVDEFEANAYDFYVLWGVNLDTGEAEPIGWATRREVGRAPIKVLSKRTNYENYSLPRGQLRPIGTMERWLRSLYRERQLADGRTYVERWDGDRMICEITREDGRSALIYTGHDAWFASCSGGQRFPAPEPAMGAALDFLRR